MAMISKVRLAKIYLHLVFVLAIYIFSGLFTGRVVFCGSVRARVTRPVP